MEPVRWVRPPRAKLMSSQRFCDISSSYLHPHFHLPPFSIKKRGHPSSADYQLSSLPRNRTPRVEGEDGQVERQGVSAARRMCEKVEAPSPQELVSPTRCAHISSKLHCTLLRRSDGVK